MSSFLAGSRFPFLPWRCSCQWGCLLPAPDSPVKRAPTHRLPGRGMTAARPGRPLTNKPACFLVKGFDGPLAFPQHAKLARICPSIRPNMRRASTGAPNLDNLIACP